MSATAACGVVTGVLVRPIDRYRGGVDIHFDQGIISAIVPREGISSPFILPGFIDSHVHIESSMLTPEQFARMAIKHGTVAMLADPHEVANVAGLDGIRFMVASASRCLAKVFFGVPSCVPASPLERSGAILSAAEVKQLLGQQEFLFLAEMMNVPGVLSADHEVMSKVAAARALGKPIDGHAPGLSGEPLERYAQVGISTDHECTSLAEAEEKVSLGMRILIRQGSAARNLDALMPLIGLHPDRVMLCTDDCHPDLLLQGHINTMLATAVAQGYDLFDVLRAASVNPILHYGLPVGMLRVHDPADFVLVDSLTQFNPSAVFIGGRNVMTEPLETSVAATPPSYNFRSSVQQGALTVHATGTMMNVIEAMDSELITGWGVYPVPVPLGHPVESDPEADLLKIILLDRYSEAPPVVAFVRGFGLRFGAIASSVAHDSHHVVAIGTSDRSLESALRWVVASRGGICFAHGDDVQGLSLPVFGLMSNAPGVEVASRYAALDRAVKQAGSTLAAPFMTASFMALTVIPKLKINHNGLFDTNAFRNVPLFTNL